MKFFQSIRLILTSKRHLLKMIQFSSHPPDDQGRCILGAHTSAAGGAWNALKEGKSIDATGVQLFTASQRKWTTKPLTDDAGQLFQTAKIETGVRINMSHGSYLINLGSNKPDLLEKSKSAFKDELRRCQTLGIDFLTFHPGAATGSTANECMDRIVESLIDMTDLVKLGSTKILLESTAGQGSCIGSTFEELKRLVDGVSDHFPIGVCLDTCHVFAAGYDLRTPETFDRTFKEFDRIVGLQYLNAFHVNDSLGYLGSKIDRHAKLGEGHLGWETFRMLMTDPRTADVPKYLETPGGPETWMKEIEILRGLALGKPCPKNRPSIQMKMEKTVKEKVEMEKVSKRKTAKEKISMELVKEEISDGMMEREQISEGAMEKEKILGKIVEKEDISGKMEKSSNGKAKSDEISRKKAKISNGTIQRDEISIKTVKIEEGTDRHEISVKKELKRRKSDG